MFAVTPRSTRSHCGSEPAPLAQRVPESPSNALRGAQQPPDDDAVAGLFRESSTSAKVPTVSVDLVLAAAPLAMDPVSRAAPRVAMLMSIVSPRLRTDIRPSSL
jgi:hypothetical protein